MGEKMDVKPVTLAIHEVADGKMSVAASDIDIKDVE
jgi:DNA-directed RNA polymerase subunit K/omega